MGNNSLNIPCQKRVEVVQPVKVAMQRTYIPFTNDLALWVVINNSTEAISFNEYKNFIDNIMCTVGTHIQDEQHRLSLQRRAYEYDHHYGLTLYGKAVPRLRPADSRSKFIEGFHNLLHQCSISYRDEDDTTVIADGFPILNSLKEVHMLLAQGAHNQYGDLPWMARMEMLMEQWLLARPEMREFLGGRIMVPYPEVRSAP